MDRKKLSDTNPLKEKKFYSEDEIREFFIMHTNNSEQLFKVQEQNITPALPGQHQGAFV